MSNVIRIMGVLKHRDVPAAQAAAAARLLDAQGLSAINVKSAFQLGRGISHDIVMDVLEGVSA